LGVIRAAHALDPEIHVFACETRPFLQGARLTAYELKHDHIPFTLITDNAAGCLMRRGKVDLVLVGADRIAANGDVANKIGTYTLAVLAHTHNVPFYVAAPRSTIDPSLSDGHGIQIEERDPKEITQFMGRALAPAGTTVWNPAFDITPYQYITGIVTEVESCGPAQSYSQGAGGVEVLGGVPRAHPIAYRLRLFKQPLKEQFQISVESGPRIRAGIMDQPIGIAFGTREREKPSLRASINHIGMSHRAPP
jgi:hypothetical protein